MNKAGKKSTKNARSTMTVTLPNGQPLRGTKRPPQTLCLAIPTSHDLLDTAIELIEQGKVAFTSTSGGEDCTPQVEALLLKARESHITQDISRVLGSQAAQSLFGRITVKPGRHGRKSNSAQMTTLLYNAAEGILAQARAGN